MLGVVAQLLDLAGGRLTASQVLDLAGRAPVRRRFRLDDDDLARIAQWARDGGVRWGLDAAQRASYRLDRLPANTWQAGWDRVLVGVAMAEEGQRLFGGVLPLDDVGSGDIDLAGRFAEFLERLHAIVDAFADPMPLDAWAAAIAEAADSLTAAPGREAWQRVQLGRLLEDVVAEGTTAGAVTQTALALPEIRALLADRLRGRPTRASFRTGHLTICTLVPMRSVPHRVVCLMGLDDGVFPRQTARDGDDLLLARSARRRSRRPQRGPPAAARRGAGRDRPPGDHVRGPGRADEPAAAAGRPARRAARRRRSHRAVPRRGDDARAGGRRAPAAAVRPAQLRRRRAGARADVELRPGRARRCAGAGGRPGRRAAVPRRAVAARARSP